MSLSTLKGINIVGVTSSVPNISSTERFDNIENVNVRNSRFEQTTSDLAFDAASRLIGEYDIDSNEIGVLIFLSRTPDYRSPNTAAVLQGRLKISCDCICYDINKGNNGFFSGIQVVGGILSNLNKKYGLVLFGDTPGKLFHEGSYFSRIESDAASAILLERDLSAESSIVSFNQSFGEYFKDFSVLKGGFRYYNPGKPFDATERQNFEVSFRRETVRDFLSGEFGIFRDRVELFADAADPVRLYHSQLFLLNILDRNELPFKAAYQVVQEFGNTYGSNIPLQLSILAEEAGIPKSSRLSCFAFGEGLELSFISFRLPLSRVLPTHVFEGFFEDYRISHNF